MLPIINRLKKTKDIEKAIKEGQGSKTGFLFIKAAKNGLDVSRFAFIISKKVAAGAVQRNQVKRRLRSIIKEEAPRIKTGVDVVIVAQKGIIKQDFQGIRKDVFIAFEKMKLLNWQV